MSEVAERIKRNQRRADGRCMKCGTRPAEEGRTRCTRCLDIDWESYRRRELVKYRIKKGLPVDARVNGWRDRDGECTRCTSPHEPGQKLCAMHLRLLSELGREPAIEEEEGR